MFRKKAGIPRNKLLKSYEDDLSGISKLCGKQEPSKPLSKLSHALLVTGGSKTVAGLEYL